MNDERCREFLADPESDPLHLETCARCRGELEELDRISARLVREFGPEVLVPRDLPQRLPVAPWEGASQRSWPFVAAVAIILLLGAALLFFAAGVSPVEGFFAAGRQALAPLAVIARVAGSLSKLVWNAPGGFHLALAVGFVLVNLLLYFLIRRAPKGIDASTR